MTCNGLSQTCALSPQHRVHSASVGMTIDLLDEFGDLSLQNFYISINRSAIYENHHRVVDECTAGTMGVVVAVTAFYV